MKTATAKCKIKWSRGHFYRSPFAVNVLLNLSILRKIRPLKLSLIKSLKEDVELVGGFLSKRLNKREFKNGYYWKSSIFKETLKGSLGKAFFSEGIENAKAQSLNPNESFSFLD